MANKQVYNIRMGLQTGTENTVYAAWSWDEDHTKCYKIYWQYATGDGIWWKPNEGEEVHYKQSTYTPPANATKVRIKIKPISTTHKVNGKDTSYWTADYCTYQVYKFSDNPPSKPGVPDVSGLEGLKLTVKLDNINPDDNTATHIEFRMYGIGGAYTSSPLIPINARSARYTFNLTPGFTYKVQCRAVKVYTLAASVITTLSGASASSQGATTGREYSDWSDWSSEVVAPPGGISITSLKATSETSIYVGFTGAPMADNYEVQYTTKKEYFDANPSEVKNVTVESTVRCAYVTGVESGQKYFFRVRATSDAGEGPWSAIQEIIIGEAPAAPTTWSSTTTNVAGDPLTLYFVHNTEDGSSWTKAQLELTINGVASVIDITNTETDEDEKDKTYAYPINTTPYTEGTKILWRVRTAGIYVDGSGNPVYGDWSTQRTVDVYGPVSLALQLTDSTGAIVDTLSSFPLHVSAVPGPDTQTPMTYSLTIAANEAYMSEDEFGNEVWVSAGEVVYSGFFDISTDLSVNISAGDVNLENNVDYTVTCTVAMNSGLTAEATARFIVAWTDSELNPNASVDIDWDNFGAIIRPYCEDAIGNIVEGVTLAVYRREFDGRFTEIESGIPNTGTHYSFDTHPALDYARYRIVATSNDTGAVSYYDVPAQPFGEIAVIISWNERWMNYDTDIADESDIPTWTGSRLRLPYNIDVSDSFDPDVELIKYAGREEPVSYYGTHKGSSSTWNVEIDKKDTETLNAIRRLSVYMGDVYVREPSGTGYWANIKVSYSTKHCELTIPVTFNITRVAGGM